MPFSVDLGILPVSCTVFSSLVCSESESLPWALNFSASSTLSISLPNLGCPGQAPLSVVLDREWLRCPGIWVWDVLGFGSAHGALGRTLVQNQERKKHINTNNFVR